MRVRGAGLASVHRPDRRRIKQRKPGGLVVQIPGAKCGDRGQVKRALQIGVIEGSGHVCPGKLNRPPLPSGDRGAGWEISEEVERRPDRCRMWDIRRGGMRDSRPGGMRWLLKILSPWFLTQIKELISSCEILSKWQFINVRLTNLDSCQSNLN